MGYFSDYRYLNLSQNWPKYTLLNHKPAWKCSVSSQYRCSCSWDLYGHLIQPGFFPLPLCSLTTGISQDPKSRSLIQLLSITALGCCMGKQLASWALTVIQSKMFEWECCYLRGFPPALYTARAASLATLFSSALSLVHSAMFTARLTFLFINLNSLSYQVINY